MIFTSVPTSSSSPTVTFATTSDSSPAAIIPVFFPLFLSWESRYFALVVFCKQLLRLRWKIARAKRLKPKCCYSAWNAMEAAYVMGERWPCSRCGIVWAVCKWLQLFRLLHIRVALRRPPLCGPLVCVSRCCGRFSWSQGWHAQSVWMAQEKSWSLTYSPCIALANHLDRVSSQLWAVHSRL